jgi:hypothetical protein
LERCRRVGGLWWRFQGVYLTQPIARIAITTCKHRLSRSHAHPYLQSEELRASWRSWSPHWKNHFMAPFRHGHRSSVSASCSIVEGYTYMQAGSCPCIPIFASVTYHIHASPDTTVPIFPSCPSFLASNPSEKSFYNVVKDGIETNTHPLTGLTLAS